MREVTVNVDDVTTVVVRYSADDGIWKLEPEKRQRKAIADALRKMTKWADARVHEKVVERG